MTVEVLFWCSLWLIAYPYAIYPLLLFAFNRLAGRGPHAAPGGHEPTISIILPVHNEAARIRVKVQNLQHHSGMWVFSPNLYRDRTNGFRN